MKNAVKKAYKNYDSVNLLGVNIDVVDGHTVPKLILEHLLEDRPATIFNVNVHAMNLAYSNDEFRNSLNKADIVFSDGFGVNLGATLLGLTLGSRMTYADHLDDILAFCAKHKKRIFLLGDIDEVGRLFKAAAIKKHPELIFSGTHHGFFEKKGEESDQVVTLINDSNTDVLMLAMSMPLQEVWCDNNKSKLNTTINMSIGGLPRIYIGWIARGPKWMTDNGLEWFYRLMVQRSTVFNRYVIGNPLFFFRILKSRLFGSKR